MTIYFTSDFHLSHQNIIGYTGRPFKDIKDMDDTIINNYNEVVKPGDTCFFLGDFSFAKGSLEETISRFNVRPIFIKGNHDHSSLSVITCCLIMNKGEEIFLTHDPKDADPFYRINIVGHVHGKWKNLSGTKKGIRGHVVNCGVDVWFFKPASLQEILDLVKSEEEHPQTQIAKEMAEKLIG